MLNFVSRIISNLLIRRERFPFRIKFGKYTERFELSVLSKKWEEAIDLYQKGEVLNSYLTLLDFLTDPKQKNLEYSKVDGKISFKLYQGSKVVVGMITDEKVSAISEIATFKRKPDIYLTEMLLQENHKLKYSKFIKTETSIALYFESPTNLINPTDLYYALKEVAINADRLDDILVDRFKYLEPINTQHITDLDEGEKQIKIHYLRSWLKQTLAEVDKYLKDKDLNKGIISYLLLDVIYKIYYLIAPEGVLLDYLKQLDKFYRTSTETTIQKNDYLYNALEELLNWDDRYIARYLYQVKSTFSTVSPVSSSKIADFIISELEAANWFRMHRNTEIFFTIIEYIIGYLNFHIALKPLHKDLLNIVWQILNNDYFLSLGFTVSLVHKDKLNSFAVEKKINDILNFYNSKGFKVGRLDYSTKVDFLKTFFNEFVNMLQNEGE